MGDKPKKVYGYEVREPSFMESSYFLDNPHVSGMATEDGRIILNQQSKLDNKQKQSVLQNEAARLFLKQSNIVPDFDITDEQRNLFIGTEYERPENELYLKHTILGRIISNDPSAGKVTDQQRKWAEWLLSELKKRK